jgi:hypothetical protein
MNFQNFYMLPNPDVAGDYFVFGDIYDNDGLLLGTFGPNGTSVFGWWVTQDVAFQQNYSTQFAVIMAQEIVAGTAE